MTSIEWLKEKLFYDFGFAFSDNIYKQAKEMHKKEIIEAHLDGQSLVSCKDEYAEQYYQETFVSEGSGMSEKPNNHIDAQLPQQEISDEEIEKKNKENFRL